MDEELATRASPLNISRFSPTSSAAEAKMSPMTVHFVQRPSRVCAKRMKTSKYKTINRKSIRVFKRTRRRLCATLSDSAPSVVTATKHSGRSDNSTSKIGFPLK